MLLHLCFPLMLVFQFHKGTIRTQRCSVTLTTLAHFNSIKVQLEPALQTSSFTTLRNFNSIKVQLEPSAPSHQCPLSTVFQFHKGTIRTIKSLFVLKIFLDFNSIKVQLELLGELCMPSYREFQFHKGTIRTFSSYEHDFYT